MPVIPFVPYIIGGAATVWGAHEAASATKDAAQTSASASDKAAQLQADTANRALDIQKSMFDARMANLAPYRALGGSAGSSLSSLMGYPAPSAAATAPNQQAGIAAMQALAQQAKTPMAAQPTSGGGLGDWLMRGVRSQPGYESAQPTSGGMFSAMGGAVGQAAAPLASLGGAKLVRAPNGGVYQIPADQLQQALANGGTVING